MATFGERAEGMGLDATYGRKGLYFYSDRYGRVAYRTLSAQTNTIEGEIDLEHPTDGMTTPLIGIFTTNGEGDGEFQYAGYVSDSYKFIGNDVLNQRVRESITSVGMPILEENTIFSNMNCRMRNEIIIQNGQNIPQVGDVLPVMIVNNSYNGTRAASLSFGIAINDIGGQVGRSIFAFSLGEMRQVHIDSSDTQVTSAIGSYMQVFTEDIADMITQSFNSHLTSNEMLAVLDVIEGIGKNRREKISEILSELNPKIEGDEQPRLPSAWQVFLAIVRYSSLEPNLNSKKLLENIAQSVLVIPTRMYGVLEQLQG